MQQGHLIQFTEYASASSSLRCGPQAKRTTFFAWCQRLIDQIKADNRAAIIRAEPNTEKTPRIAVFIEPHPDMLVPDTSRTRMTKYQYLTDEQRLALAERINNGDADVEEDH